MFQVLISKNWVDPKQKKPGDIHADPVVDWTLDLLYERQNRYLIATTDKKVLLSPRWKLHI